MFNDLSKDKRKDVSNEFLGMLHGIPFRDPKVVAENAYLANKKSIDSLLKQNPKLGGTTNVDILLNLPDSICKKNSAIKSARGSIVQLCEKLQDNFRLFSNDYLIRLNQESKYGSETVIESHTESVREFLAEFYNKKVGSRDTVSSKGQIKKLTYKQLKIKEVYKDEDTDEAATKNIINSLLLVSTLIPDKYKKNVPPLTVIVRGNKSLLKKLFSAASFESPYPVIVLNVRNNSIIQAAEAMHEYIHLIEKYNPKVMKASNEYLKQRRVVKLRQTIKDICLKYGKKLPNSSKVGQIEVYEANFVDPYIGKVYGDLDGKVAVPTEVLTIGSEMLFLEPSTFCVRDRGFFDFITQFLTGSF